MKKLKFLIIVILIFISNYLTADSMQYIFGLNAAAYYLEYPEYKYDQPILGLQAQLDIFNIVDIMGIGGATFQKVYSSDDRFSLLRSYNFYLHSFANYATKDSYFTYGFYGGIKRTEINYEDDKTSIKDKVTIHMPLLGFRFASEKWGMDISWTQAENRKPILGYELKFRNSNGMIMRIGRINRGVISGIDSEIYILFGYEFFK
ncbi:MAG: hypothetical protein P9M11_08010 [Candidatus Tenebribacter burtonii]|jgi:hypothetical protein|nr:hypothetical protein [Candidatus Tenebribacter burtonii]